MQRTSPVCFERRWVTLHFPALYVYGAADDELPLRVFDVPQGATVKLSSTNPLIWAIAGAGAQLEFVAATVESAKEWVEVLSRVALLINDEARYTGDAATVRFDMTAVMGEEPLLQQFPAAPASTSAHVLADLPVAPVSADQTKQSEDAGQPAIGVTAEDGTCAGLESIPERRRGGLRLKANQRLSDLFPREFIEKEAASKGEEAVELQLRRDARRLSQLLLKSQLQSLVTGVAEVKKRDSRRLMEGNLEKEDAMPATFEDHAVLPLPCSTHQRKRGSQSLVDIIANSRSTSSSSAVADPECTEAHDPEAVKVMLLWIRYKRVRRFKRLLEQEHSHMTNQQAEEPRTKEEADGGSFKAVLPDALARARSRSVHGLKRSSGALAFRRGRFQEARAGGSHLAFRSLRQEDFDSERERAQQREESDTRDERHSDGEDEEHRVGASQKARIARKLRVGTWSPAPSLRKVRGSTLASMIQRSTTSAAATLTNAEVRMSGVLSRTKQVLARGEESEEEEEGEDDERPRVHMPYYHQDILTRPLPRAGGEDSYESG